ncbi:MAG: hypothetical protein ACRDOC_13295 [Streptosporangiaceae bacterium]
MPVLDVLAWVVVALGAVKTIYYAVMLATRPARARRVRHGAHVRIALTGPGAPREAWQEVSGAVLAVASGIILLTIHSMSHVRCLLLVPIVAVLVIDQVVNYRDRHRAPAEPV